MTTEIFTFDKGINKRKENALLLEPGEFVSCEGLVFDKAGMLECRSAKTTRGTAVSGSIHSIHRYANNVIAGHGVNISARSLTGNLSSIDDLSASDKLRFEDYETFIFMINGTDKKAFDETNLLEWGVDNPDDAPTLAEGAAGNPSGTYTCYVTFLIMFDNGKRYETGTPTSTSITVVDKKIEWSAIPISLFSGAASIYRKLYRTVSGVVYYVTTIADNSTTTYTDDETEAQLLVNPVLTTTGYSTPPDSPVDIELHLQRLFLIKDNKLYWSEPYIPFGFKTTGYVTVSKQDEDLVCIHSWGDQLYIASKKKWYRLPGTDATTWAIKGTFTDAGIINADTVVKTKYGLLGLGYDGLYLFNGTTNKNITEIQLGHEFFTTTITDLPSCYADFDGRKYYFYYPISGTTISKCLVIDFAYYPDLIFYNDDFIATARQYHAESGILYIAKGTSEYAETGDETIATSLRCGDRVFQDFGKQKNIEYLKYEIDTDDEDVTVIIYVDDVAVHTITLNESSRTRGRTDKFPQYDGYRVSMGLSCAASQDLKIYSPWILEATPVGD